MQTEQMELVNIDMLVPENHAYRRLKNLLDFEKIIGSVKIKAAKTGAIGYGKGRLILCLLLQFMEDLSDREFERYIAENLAGKWFCGFGLLENTPDHSTICVFRNSIGTRQMGHIFQEVRRQLRLKNHCSEVFTFVDASALISKLNLWEERDEIIKKGYEKLNNETLPEVAADPEAKIGAKSANKFWYGFKKHLGIDMQSGMITRVCVTPANVPDADGVKHIIPKGSAGGAVVGDKGMIGAIVDIQAFGLHPMIILKNNMKAKNRDLDRWISGLRAPYERVFSKQNKRVRYKGVVKNQGAEFLYACAFNFRRLLTLEAA